MSVAFLLIRLVICTLSTSSLGEGACLTREAAVDYSARSANFDARNLRSRRSTGILCCVHQIMKI